MAVALLGCWLGYGFVRALLVAFLLPLRLAFHVGEFTLWAGPFAGVVVVIAAFATRRRRRSDDWWLARVGLFTLWFGPAVWLALFAGRLA